MGVNRVLVNIVSEYTEVKGREPTCAASWLVFEEDAHQTWEVG